MSALAVADPKKRLALLLREKARRAAGRRIDRYYPDTGPLRRELYRKHTLFFEKGLTQRVRAVIAANRVGKTEGMGGYEMALHLTGKYPAWWVGRRFTRPIRAWAAGDTGQTVKEILQEKLLGPINALGTGLIPLDSLDMGSVRMKRVTPDAIESCRVRHAAGGWSRLVFKSYDQGRRAFQGTEQDVILLDEEDEHDALGIFSECLIRTMTTGGLVILTFTPLYGLTPLIDHLRKSEVCEINVTWDDVPHLTDEDKRQILANTPVHLHDARSKGVPLLGEGMVFKGIREETLYIDAVPHQRHWRRIAAIDFGWDHPTAAVDLWHEPDSDIVYVANTAREREMTPILFAGRIRPWFKDGWPKVAWPHDGLQHDKKSGEQLAKAYRDAGLPMLAERATFEDGSNGLEAGIFDIYERMQTGRLKVVRHLAEWFEEFRNLHRKDGKIEPIRDDLISATRYGLMCLRYAEPEPTAVREQAEVPLIGDRATGY